MRQRRPIDTGWELLLEPAVRDRLGAPEERVEATVPGCVHTDLMGAGLLADPLVDRNELDQHWIGETCWVYRTVVAVDEPQPGERIDLVCDGLDTMATVEWNGVVVARTENQHRRYRIPVADHVVDGDNVVVVRFAPPATTAAERRDTWGELPNPYGQPYNMIRKMACNFGWDWGPRLTTSGIWRPIALERWGRARLASARPTATVAPGPVRAGERGSLDVVAEVDLPAGETADGLRVEVTVRSADGATVGRSDAAADDGAVELNVPVADVARWWPIGAGPQTRYTVDVSLFDHESVLDQVTRRVGFRSVGLDTTPDDDGSGARFEFRVNGERVWVRGFNWIPDDCFPSRITPDRLRTRIEQGAAANANLLRIWGGGLYEDDAFYDHCDEIGMLVWQDFAFACAAYPEVELRDEILAEAADNIDRLMHHPSLVVWNGNNENLVGFADWGWATELDGRPWGEAIYRRWLPDLVDALDPARPYIDGSPTSIDPAQHPNDDNYGAVHLWDVWNDLDYPHYRDHQPRFVAEFGFQAPATNATLRAAIDPDVPLDPNLPALAHRQRAFDGEAKLNRWLHRWFGEVTDHDDWLYLTQLNQARAVELGIGHFRSLHDRCSGVIWWQLNDCWPAISWSVVDSGGRTKPSWFAARRAMADRAAVVRPAGEGLAVVLLNDSRTLWVPSVSAEVFGGAAEDHRHLDVAESVRVEPGSSRTVSLCSIGDRPFDVGRSVVVVTAGGVRAVHAGPDSVRIPARFTASVVSATGGVEVEVVAQSLVRDLCLFADRVDGAATVDDQLITLLPGERHRFTVSTDAPLGAWASAIEDDPHPSVLRALDDRPVA